MCLFAIHNNKMVPELRETVDSCKRQLSVDGCSLRAPSHVLQHRRQAQAPVATAPQPRYQESCNHVSHQIAYAKILAKFSMHLLKMYIPLDWFFWHVVMATWVMGHLLGELQQPVTSSQQPKQLI